MSKSIWEKLLQDKDRQRARKAIAAIVKSHRNTKFKVHELEFYGGFPGATLLDRETIIPKKGRIKASSTLEKLPQLNSLAFAFWQKRELGEDETVLNIPYKNYITFVNKNVKDSPNLDCIAGLSCLGITAGMSGREGKVLLKNIIQTFDDKKYSERNLIFWRADPRSIGSNQLLKKNESNEKRLINTGLAHGQAGAIIFLSWALLSGKLDPATKKKTRTLIKGALNLYPKSKDHFPAFIVGKNERAFHAPGWCYGDLGIGFAMIVAGLALKEKPLVKRGEKIMLKAGSNPEVIKNHKNSLLCHGTSGTALMLARASELTGSALLLDQSRTWFQITLDRLKKNEREERGLMDSRIGVALALNACLKGEAPSWDFCMLLSSPFKKKP